MNRALLLVLATLLAACSEEPSAEPPPPSTADVTPPAVTGVRPVEGETDVPLGVEVQVTFSEPVDEATVTAASFHVDGIEGAVSYSAASRTATLTPTTPFSRGVTYGAVVTTAVKDLAGNALAEDKHWVFTMSDDHKPPVVVSTSPASNATNVAHAATVRATFNEALQPTSVNKDTFVVDGVGGTVTWDPATRSAVFTATDGLPYATTLKAHLTTGIKDLAENALAAEYTWQFTTEQDRERPRVVSTDPADQATDVDGTRPLVVVFSERLDPASLTGNVSANGSSGTVTWDDAKKAATFTPSQPFAPNATVNASVSSGIRDLAGNYLQSSVYWSFRTRADTTAPFVKSTDPADAATGVLASSKVKVTFSEPVQGVSSANFTVEQAGAAVAGAVSYDAPTSTAVFTPASPLRLGRRYTATLGANVRDYSGNVFQGPFTFSFTVEPDLVPPTLVSSLPVNGQRFVGRKTPLVLTFSEPIDPATVTPANLGLAGVGGAFTWDAASKVATFTPTAGWPAGAAVNASVSTSVTDENGVAFAAAAPVRFETVGTATRLSAPDGMTYKASAAAFDDLGDGVAAFIADSGAGSRVAVARYTAATASWSDELFLPAPSGVPSFTRVEKVVSSAGKFAVLALASIDTPVVYVFDGAGWTAPQQYSIRPNSGPTLLAADRSGSFALAMDGWGGVDLASWSAATGWKTQVSVSGGRGYALSGADELFAAVRTDTSIDVYRSSSWATPLQAAAFGAGSGPGSVDLAAKGNGFAVVWTAPGSASAKVNLHATVFNGTTMGNISQLVIDAAYLPKALVAASANGYCALYYAGLASGTYGVFAHPYTTGAWQAATSLATSAFGVSSMIGNGTDYLAAWGDSTGTGYLRATSGGAWTAAITLGKYTAHQYVPGKNGFALLSNSGGAPILREFAAGAWTAGTAVPSSAAGATTDATLHARGNGFGVLRAAPKEMAALQTSDAFATAVNLIKRPHASSGRLPHIAVAASGKSVASWQQTVNGTAMGYVAFFDGVAWGAPVNLGAALQTPELAVAGDLFVAAWNGPGLLTRSTKDGTWSAASSPTNGGVSPTLVALGSTIFMGWSIQGFTSPGLGYSTTTDGTTWSATATAPNATSVYGPTLTTNGADVLALYLDSVSGAQTYYARVYQGGMWTVPQPVGAGVAAGAASGFAVVNSQSGAFVFANGAWTTRALGPVGSSRVLLASDGTGYYALLGSTPQVYASGAWGQDTTSMLPTLNAPAALAYDGAQGFLVVNQPAAAKTFESLHRVGGTFFRGGNLVEGAGTVDALKVYANGTRLAGVYTEVDDAEGTTWVYAVPKL